jgi:hypothetical protein
LNSEQSTLELGPRYRFAASSVKALNGVLQHCGAYVVITSTWREHWALRDNALFLEQEGVLPGRVVGKTPRLDRERGAEIDSWLGSVPYPVSAFVILDDRDDMGMHRERLIQVDPRGGLNSTHALRAIAMLGAGGE